MTQNRLRLLILLAGLLILAAVYTYPYWQSALNGSATVRITFPGLNATSQAAYNLLEAVQQKAYRDLLKEQPTLAVALAQGLGMVETVVPAGQQATPVMTTPQKIASGFFTDLDTLRISEGIVTVYQLPDGAKILRLSDFKVTNGENLHVILTRKKSPVDGKSVGSDYVDLGVLQGSNGSQNYSVPNEVDFNDYQAVVIYRLDLGIVYAVASLTVL